MHTAMIAAAVIMPTIQKFPMRRDTLMLNHDMAAVITVIISNGASFMAIVGIYTRIIHKQAQIEFLIKRLCDKAGISTETGL